MSVTLAVPPFLNTFLRRASLKYFLSLLLIASAFSCSARIVATAEQATEILPQIPDSPYPDTIVDDNLENKSNEDSWQCGYEWIVVEGPDGQLIQSQIPLSCDPSADVYLGCPSNLISVTN